MSRKNYTNYNNMSSNTEPEKVVVEPAVDVTEKMVEETTVDVTEEVVTEPENKPVYAYVDNCEKLNIRKNPNKNADVRCVIPAKTEVTIDLAKSTVDWYSVCTASGIEGFCMKNFLTIK